MSSARIKSALSPLVAIIATQTTATLITAYGILLAPMGWRLAPFVWGYRLVMLFIIDSIKVRLYQLLDHRDTRFRR
jgi:H+-transporting ATPase